MSAGRVRQGGVFVEIGADARKFFATLDKINKQVGKVGSAIAGVGSRMAGIGTAMAAPFVAAGVAGSRFQDVMLNVQASTGATAAELDQVRKAAMAMSQSLGVGPTEAAAGFLELLKAGMAVEQVLGGAGKAAIAFAKVGGMAVADAAVVMADAMNVFKVTGDVAANTLSAAADASSTSIEGIAMAFSQVSAVAGLANQSIQDTAASLAVLANAGIKGSDAGTSLKTMLMRLMAPAEDAVGALSQVGLSVQSFRNADGTMKPMVEIVRTLSTALEGMDQAAKDDIFRRIFGQDAIRAAAVMTAAGVDGFNAMRDGMAGAMTVGDKYATMSSGLSGAVATLRAAMERLAIAVSDAVGPAFMDIAATIGPLINGFTTFVSANKELVGQFAKGVAIFTGVGVSLIGMGSAIQLASVGIGGLLTAFIAVPATVISAAASLATFVLSTVAAGISSAISAATIATAWVGSALPGVLTFVGAAVSSLASYVAACAGAVAATVLDAAVVAISWANAALPGVLAFVASAISGLASYVASCVAAVAASVSSAAAVAAAWLAPVAPILAIGAALGGAAMLAYQFGGQIKSALGGVGELAGQAGNAIGSAFGQVISDAAVVFGDLATTAKTTFSGIYEAIASGDLSGAMDILWAGLQAGWLRGVEALMSYVDPWVAFLQNTFTYMGTGIATTWESMWSGLVQGANTIGAVVMGVVDNLVNGVMAAFDAMVAAVRKSWNWVQSFIVKGYDLAKENQKVDSEMSARARERGASRPGVTGRVAEAQRQNDETARQAQGRIDAMNQSAAHTAQGRYDENARRAEERRAATVAAEDRLGGLVAGQRDQRIFRAQADAVTESLGTATTMDEVRALAEEFHLLAATGKITQEQLKAFSAAAETAQERIEGERGASSATTAPVDPESVKKAATDAAASQSEVAGSFSAQALSGMGFGQSLAQKQLDTLKAIEQNTRVTGDGLVAA